MLRVEPILSKQQMASDDVPQQMLLLLGELLRSKELPELAIGGAWCASRWCLTGRPLGSVAMSIGLVDLAVEHLQEIGTPGDMVSISRGKAGRGYWALHIMHEISKSFAGQAERPDLEACTASGMFDICVEVVASFASRGVAHLQDTNHSVLFIALVIIGKCRAQPGCEAKIRGVANALSFCLKPEHSLAYNLDFGSTTGSEATKLVCGVFGRDESGSEFTFTRQDIDLLTRKWSEYVHTNEGWMANTKPSADTIFAVDLCVSDVSIVAPELPVFDQELNFCCCVFKTNKHLLVANPDFITYCLKALLLDPNHPRAGMRVEDKAWCQQHHCEARNVFITLRPAQLCQMQTNLTNIAVGSQAILQLAVYETSREALLRDNSAIAALEAVVKDGLSKASRETAAAALAALANKETAIGLDGPKHVMLSYCEGLHWTATPRRKTTVEHTWRFMVHHCCDESVLVYADQWDVQATIARLNESLIARGYATWFDLTNMKGSTVDAMSDAIERADVMLYGVSLRYKESANVCAALHCVLNSLKAPVLQLDCLNLLFCSVQVSIRSSC